MGPESLNIGYLDPLGLFQLATHGLALGAKTLRPLHLMHHSILQPPRNQKLKLFHKDQMRKPSKFKVLLAFKRLSYSGTVAQSLSFVYTPNGSEAKSSTPKEGIHLKQRLRFLTPSTPQLPCKTPQIPSNRDHKALNRATLGV